jgi:hypothetical protein
LGAKTWYRDADCYGGIESKMAITENESENKYFGWLRWGNFDWLTWVIGFLCGVLTTLVLVPH